MTRFMPGEEKHCQEGAHLGGGACGARGARILVRNSGERSAVDGCDVAVIP